MVVVVVGIGRGREAVEAVRDGVERALMMVHWKQTSVTIVRGGLVITGSVFFHGGACAGSVGGSTEGLDCVDFTRLQAEWSGVEWSGVGSGSSRSVRSAGGSPRDRHHGERRQACMTSLVG